MTDLQQPVVSIVMPTCNRANLLKKSVESVISQSYQNWELLVIDDISTDDTEKMMTEYSKKDPRIKYFRIVPEKVPGISKYLNFGIKNAAGKYISRLDDDDYWCDNDILKLEVEFLENNPDYVLVGGGAIIVNENYEEKYKYFKRETDEKIRHNALKANPFAHNTVMFRKDVALSLGGYDNLKYAEDWDFWLRLGKVGKLYNFKRHFACYLSTDQNTSYIKHRDMSKFLFSLIKKYKNDYPNYWKGVIVNIMQLSYAYLPDFIKKKLHTYFLFMKRNYL